MSVVQVEVVGKNYDLSSLQTAFDRFKEVLNQFFEGLTLGGSTRYRRHLRPVSALFCFVDYYFEFHGFD
jgi:hypothetical protein